MSFWSLECKLLHMPVLFKILLSTKLEQLIRQIRTSNLNTINTNSVDLRCLVNYIVSLQPHTGKYISAYCVNIFIPSQCSSDNCIVKCQCQS